MPHSSLTAAHLKPTEHRDFSKRGVEDTYYAEMQGLSMPSFDNSVSPGRH